jgi:serine/threonine protein kinase
VLSKIAGEHLVKAPFSFTEGAAHFFVLEYMPGGDLSRLIEEQVYLGFEESRLYLAEIVLAIEHLHECGIIHRDLKPENLVFDENCHLKLTDFGLSEMRINDKLRKAKLMMNTCGTDGFKGR